MCADGITVPTGTWSVQMYISTAYGGVAPGQLLRAPEALLLVVGQRRDVAVEGDQHAQRRVLALLVAVVGAGHERVGLPLPARASPACARIGFSGAT